MKRYKTYYLAPVLAIIFLYSCSKENTSVPDTQYEIQFNKVSTKADLNDLKNDGFGVWAAVSSTSDNYQFYFSNEKVYYDDIDGWKSQETHYWVRNCMFYFFGIYPFDPENEIIENVTVPESNLIGYGMNITTPDNADYDPLVASNVTDTNDEDYSKTVNLNFEHLMSKIKLTISQDFDKTPDFDYYVQKVSISGITGQGMFMTVPYGNQLFQLWDFENSTTKTFEKYYETPVRLRNPNAADKKVVLSVFDDGLLLIPQEIASNKVRVRVDYKYDTNQNDDDLGVDKYIECYIPIGQWSSNKVINYTLSLAEQTDIKINTPTIENWGSPQTGGTIIIK